MKPEPLNNCAFCPEHEMDCNCPSYRKAFYYNRIKAACELAINTMQNPIIRSPSKPCGRCKEITDLVYSNLEYVFVCTKCHLKLCFPDCYKEDQK